ncbi:HpcH/HpaI aldolase/citrate lyase family protein [Novosphingobium sediminicola]|uniref:Citrate lyase subunit beta/citryl-CoA lyase n=1 Tax=Novosphingobium sediminicola TaxID=563162 RepID=A0A7W6CAV7_9SPHN|nr:CoA ester lyase [Novosphingobium sediminicola]MBB3953189.1 citrate lyase subunit beta/citryl-CoA lyase [Novosphingobium sediminicola]
MPALRLDRPRRSALFMPASNPKALAKAREVDADVIILDLEDAVAPEQKEAAREAALRALYTGGFGHREVAVRVNGLDTEWGADDLEALARAGADALLVPKVSSPQDVLRYHEALSDAPSDLQLWAMIETAGSVLRLDAIASLARQTRLALWVIGPNDLARELRARPDAGRTFLQPFLSLAVAAARAHGLSILDGVCNEFKDMDIFRKEAEQGLMFGFDGKTLIHPAQIAPCNEVFSPSPVELEWAGRVIEAFAQPEHAGKGAIKLDGRMVELLHRDQAQSLLALARRIAARG